MQYIFFILVLGVYGLLNYYIGLRGFQSIKPQFPISKVAYWIIIFSLAVMYFVSYLGKNRIPKNLELLLNTIGAYWLAAFIYLIVLVAIIDIFRLLSKRLKIMPDFLVNNTWFVAISVIGIVVILLAVGTYNAIVPKVTTYDVKIDKKAGSIKNLKCAMISDVHLGEIIKRDRLKNAVDIINGLEADIVVIAGDLIDNDIRPVEQDNMLEELKAIKSKYGVYAILGNHEYYANKTEEISKLIASNGVNLLRDKQLKIADSFYLVGREDKVISSRGVDRAKLSTLIADIDKSLPLIVLDHQPNGLDEPRNNGVDLQLSGHTHAGQFFPISLITKSIFEEDNGYLKDGSFNLIVSAGYGTWGPTVRIGSRSEVVCINIAFK